LIASTGERDPDKARPVIRFSLPFKERSMSEFVEQDQIDLRLPADRELDRFVVLLIGGSRHFTWIRVPCFMYGIELPDENGCLEKYIHLDRDWATPTCKKRNAYVEQSISFKQLEAMMEDIDAQFAKRAS
jgi:hypothetical protein